MSDLAIVATAAFGVKDKADRVELEVDVRPGHAAEVISRVPQHAPCR